MTAEKKNRVYRELIEWTKNPADTEDEFRNEWHGDEKKHIATGGGCGWVD